MISFMIFVATTLLSFVTSADGVLCHPMDLKSEYFRESTKSVIQGTVLGKVNTETYTHYIVNYEASFKTCVGSGLYAVETPPTTTFDGVELFKGTSYLFLFTSTFPVQVISNCSVS